DFNGCEVAERIFQQSRRIQIFDLRGSAGAVGELLGSVTLHQEKASPFDRPLDALEYSLTKRRVRELDEDRHDHVELGGRPRPGGEIHLLKLRIDSSQRRQ